MKTFDMHSSQTHKTLLLAGLVALTQIGARAEEQSTETASDAANWVDIGVGGSSISGNDAAFQRRFGNNGDFYGGIKDMHYERKLGDDTISMDGHALFELQDYDLSLEYLRDGVGFVRGGYREFRRWYDGSGGYAGAATQPGWIDPITEYSDELHLDRGEVWLEAGLRMEDLPEVTFGYTHGWRDGRKDSTMWGGSSFYGPSYGFIPGYYDIDETKDTYTLDVAHTIGNTDLALGLRAEFVDNENGRVLEEGDITNQENYSYDLFGARMSSTTRLNEKLIFSFGYLLDSMDTDIGGSHVEGDPSASHSYEALSGGTNYQQSVFTGNLWWSPVEDLVIVPSVRSEWQDTSGYSTGMLDGNTIAAGYEDRLYSSDTNIQETTESIEMRYSGIDNFLLFAVVELTQNDEDLDLDLTRVNNVPASVISMRDVSIDTDTEKYTLGANWYATSKVSLSAQYFYKELEQDFDNVLTGTTSALDAEIFRHGYSTHDANIRVTWRARPNLTFVSRYDYEITEMQNQAYYNGYVMTDVTSEVDSAEITRHILSESITWSLSDSLYLQGSFSLIKSQTDLPVDEGPNDVPVGFIQDWDNDYFVATLGAGYAINSKTDIKANYSYYRSDSFVAVPNSMNFGMDTEEHVISMTLNRMINENVSCYMSYGFVTSNSKAADQTGGFNDFDAHMVSSGLQVRF